MYFQSGALQNSTVRPRNEDLEILQSDERWKHFYNGGFQLSGPLGKSPWSYFAAVSGRELKSSIRSQPAPVSGTVQQHTYNFTGSVTPNDRAGIYISLQHRNEPQYGESSQISRDSSVNQRQNYRNVHGSWTHNFSSRRVLDAKFGLAHSHITEQFQNGATGQSSQDLFPGYVVDGITPLSYMLQGYGRLINTSRGPAPLIKNSSPSSLEGNFTYSIFHDGVWNSKHRMTVGGSVHRASLSETQSAMDGLNVLFFEGEPNSVRLLNTPARTQDRVTELELYATDNFTISRLSFLAQGSLHNSRLSNVLRSGQTVNNIRWSDASGRVGAGIQLIHRLVFRVGYADIFDQANLAAISNVNPEGLGTALFSWNDVNGDRLFQTGENTQLLKVNGAPFTRLDPNLKNPRTSEFTIGFTQNGLKGFYTEFFGFRRRVHNQMSLVNDGVPFSSFDPIQVIDPGWDAVLGSADDRTITVYNQNSQTLGQDRYVLTNPAGFYSHSEGFEFSVGLNSDNIQANTTVTRYREVADSAPGLTARENDPRNLLGVFDDPNNAIHALGSTFFDRGTLVRMRVSMKLPAGLHFAAFGNYQDGLPYARILPVPLNQGVIGILMSQRGPGNGGTIGGIRTTHYQTIDTRFSRNFKLGKGTLITTLDIFNLANLSLNLVQMAVTSHHAEWRVPLQFETPRSIQPGLRYTW